VSRTISIYAEDDRSALKGLALFNSEDRLEQAAVTVLLAMRRAELSLSRPLRSPSNESVYNFLSLLRSLANHPLDVENHNQSQREPQIIFVAVALDIIGVIVVEQKANDVVYHWDFHRCRQGSVCACVPELADYVKAIDSRVIDHS
jgi:hypothetical protein